jgi:hypothetical protein
VGDLHDIVGSQGHRCQSSLGFERRNLSYCGLAGPPTTDDPT